MANRTPRRNLAEQAKHVETRKRLEKCWAEDIDWNLYPEVLKSVSSIAIGCKSTCILVQ